jgi:hypothetical protein
MLAPLDYATPVRAPSSIPERSWAALALTAVAVVLWRLAQPTFSNRTYEGATPWNIRNWDQVLWIVRCGRLSVAAATYAVVCAGMGFKSRKAGTGVVLVASVCVWIAMVVLNGRCFGMPGAYWPKFASWEFR